MTAPAVVRTKVKGYTKRQTPSNPSALPGHVSAELQALERAQPNTDTVTIRSNAALRAQRGYDYLVTSLDRIVLIDSSAASIVVQLPPATTRFANSLVLVKISTDANNCAILPAGADHIGTSTVLQGAKPNIVFVLSPDGRDPGTWWIVGMLDQITIVGGVFTKVTVDANGNVTAGGALDPSDIPANFTAGFLLGFPDV